MSHANKRLSLIVLFVAASVVGFAARSGRAAERVAQWAPKDALVYVGVPNVDDLVAAYKKTPAWKAFDDPALKDQMQPWKKLAERLQERVAEKLGLPSPKALAVWPHGGVAVFAQVAFNSASDDDDDDFRLGAVADFGEDVERVRKLAGQIVEYCAENGGKRTTDEFGGVAIVAVEVDVTPEDEDSDSADEMSPDMPEVDPLFEDAGFDEMETMFLSGLLEVARSMGTIRFAFAFQGPCLVAGSDIATVKDTLRRLQEAGDDSLAESPAGRLLRKRCAEDADIECVFNLPALVKGLSQADEEARGVMRAAGLTALGPLVFTVETMPADSLVSRVRGFMEIDAETGGVGRMLMMKNIETAPPPAVSADAVIYASVNLDPPTILREVMSIAERVSPETAEEMRAGLKIPQEDGSLLDLDADVVARLAGPLRAAFTAIKPYGPDDFNLLVCLGHKSRDAMAKLFAMIPPGFCRPTEMLGQTVFELEMMPGLAFGYTDRSLVPAATRKGLEAYIRSEGQASRGLAQEPEFKRAARQAPKESCVVVYVDGGALAKAQVAIAEAGDVNPNQPPMGRSFGGMIRWFMGMAGAAQKPEALKALQKYQGTVLMTLAAEGDGLRLDAVALAPSDKN